MKLLITLFLILISLLALPAQALESNDYNNVLNNVNKFCSINTQEELEKLNKIKKDKDYNYNIENYVQTLREKCVDNEVNKYLEENHNKDDYNRSKLFFEAIAPLQVYPTSRQFNSVSWAVGVSNVIQQLNRFIRADNWICLPNFTTSWLSSELNSKIGLTDCIVVDIIDLNPILKSILEFAVILLVPFILFFIANSFGQKDKLGYIFKNSGGLIIKISLISLSGVFFSTLIFGLNTSNVMIFNIFNSTGVYCQSEQGIACVSNQIMKSTQKMDFIKLKASDLQEPTKDQSWFDALGKSVSNSFKADAVWTAYYLVLFIFIGGISFYCACVFASSQILIWLRIIIHFLSSYLSMLIPHSDIWQVIKGTGNLALNSMANVACYTLLIFFTTSILKNGLNGLSIFLILVIFTAYSMLSTYFFNVLQIRALKNETADISYKALYEKTMSTASTVKNKAGNLINAPKNAINSIQTNYNNFQTRVQGIGKKLKTFKFKNPFKK